MLVLSRKSDEQVLFPELGIVVKVIRVRGNQVRLGIDAPDSVRILRGELKTLVDEFENFPVAVDSDHVVDLGSAAVA